MTGKIEDFFKNHNFSLRDKVESYIIKLLTYLKLLKYDLIWV
jgi:hypothetical protein